MDLIGQYLAQNVHIFGYIWPSWGKNLIFYRNPPPSFMEGGMGGSAVDRIGADTDALLSIPDD